ncbi:MAG: replication and repair protein RecF protein [Berkelbacteria bacterium GW2011_GWA2_46_7]|uniref:DNA replication and repair protein RecF n=1 Tax=Berkelbacteria bacterium GW2011_GWA2_46_7 TaxID=1618335 RepID=A0A0G1SLG1_9BACT|nr:MAG: replication and repair protein RecF protein [Berkelbacteria bacterium GW2011_GWA2_46_7]
MISALELENLRNFTEKGLSFTKRSFITGSNGAGKSSILEAVRILSVGKSFRTSRLEEAIRFEERYFRLKATIQTSQELELFYGNQFETEEIKERRLTFAGNQVSWSDFLGEFPTVLFTPNDLDIVLGSPDGRRKYLDSVLWQVSAEYRRTQVEFWQVLRERSALLFMVKINRASPEELSPWNELLSKLTAFIRLTRIGYIDYLNNWLGSKLENQNFKIVVNYQSDPRPIEEFNIQEIKSAQNLFGAHRDELVIKFDDYSARRFASRGQSRLTVAHLKAAEADYLDERTGNPVTILLDDAMSELDSDNTLRLLELYSDEHQLILTSAEPLKLPEPWSTIKL